MNIIERADSSTIKRHACYPFQEMENLAPALVIISLLSFSPFKSLLPGPSPGEYVLIGLLILAGPQILKMKHSQVPAVFGIGILLLLLLSVSTTMNLIEGSMLRYKTLVFWTLHAGLYLLSYTWLIQNPEKRIPLIIKTLMLLGLLVSLLAILQYMIGPQLCSSIMPWGPSWTRWYTRFGFRVYSFFDNPLLAGTILCLLWPLFLQLVFEGEGPKNQHQVFSRRLVFQRTSKKSSYLHLALVGTAIILTGSRSCLLVVILISCIQVMPHVRVRHIFAISGIVVLIMLVTLFSPAGKRLLPIFSIDGDSNLNNRVSALESGMEMLAEHPMFGIGPGYFRQAYEQHYKPVNSQDDPSSYTLDNLIFQIACEFGIPAALMCIIIFFNITATCTGSFKESIVYRQLFFSFLSFGILSLGIALFSTPVMWILMILFSIVSAKSLNGSQPQHLLIAHKCN